MKNTNRGELIINKFKFLEASSDFNNDIKIIRSKCGFLKKGYPLTQLEIEYKSNKGILKHCIYPIGIKQKNSEEIFLKTNNNLENDISFLINKYKLTYLFDWQILYFIIFNRFDDSDITIPVNISTKSSYKNDGSRALSESDKIILEITSQTRLEDIQKIWPEIKEIQKEYPAYIGASKIHSKKIFERDEFILKKHKKGLSAKDIADALEKMYVRNPNFISDKRLPYLEKIY